MKVVKAMKVVISMKCFQNYMKAHPRKRLDGFCDFCGKPMTHEQIKRLVDYAVEKGYETNLDIPAEEVQRIIDEMA